MKKKKYIRMPLSILSFTVSVQIFKKSWADVARPWQMGFQDPATPIMEGIINFNNELMFLMISISFFVGWMLFRALDMFDYDYNKKVDNFTHSTLLEIVWTISPALILLVIAFPSFNLLYSMDEVVDYELTLKVIGHQWYWSYEFSDYKSSGSPTIKFDSYMIPEDELEIPIPGVKSVRAGKVLRLLEVDNRVLLPSKTHIRVLVTSSDVLHSWAVPSLGVKIDSCPGRLNQISLYIKRNGVFYGQCSEICGVNHGFMPIVVRSVSVPHYCRWALTKISEMD